MIFDVHYLIRYRKKLKKRHEDSKEQVQKLYIHNVALFRFNIVSRMNNDRKKKSFKSRFMLVILTFKDLL